MATHQEKAPAPAHPQRVLKMGPTPDAMVLLEVGMIVEASAGISQVATLLESEYVPESNMLS
jgi:hypothetical protein